MTTRTRMIFLDLDDVVADWIGAAKIHLNLDWPWTRGGPMIPQADWDRLCFHDRFYRDLPVAEGGHDLVRWAVDFAKKNDMEAAFLTALPLDGRVPFCKQDKIHWVNTHFPHVPLTFGPYPQDKQKHCQPGDILIDDRPENCEQWRAVGGIAHQYRSWEDCQAWINTTFNESFA